MVMTTGRRERKKAQTRKALADAAVRLFAEHGYDGVTVAQIAEAADVSIATLFAHVPDGKEALIFDDGAGRGDRLARAVRERPPGEPVPRALRRCLAAGGPFAGDLPPELRRKRDLIVNTPALRAYSRTLWIAGEPALAAAIAAESGQDPSGMAVRALARYVLEIPELAGAEPDPLAAMHAIFDLLEPGWPG
ncbi:TetR/AcrR family transcriptional regulator [Nonomuraea endophytica]|uniref:AcrR family transcriptional regulator n=1 Tax=Nonomuraea endophytica TaxID=714136 RepID=A0A7W8A7U7_9ACTN|nr:TetR family transcriptional regulator [Nonomuraea endophytica]MBB5081212.1 AcrR family transcriptional regulator [Nonomuraea endophytica]